MHDAGQNLRVSSSGSYSEFIDRCPHVCQAVQVNLTERPQECKLAKRSKVQDCESNLFSYILQKGETGEKVFASCSHFPNKDKKEYNFHAASKMISMLALLFEEML